MMKEKAVAVQAKWGASGFGVNTNTTAKTTPAVAAATLDGQHVPY